MQYINPFDLLGIMTDNLSDVNSYSINKSKRQLIAEIELSDTNTIIHDGVELNKGDCIKIIDELDNKDSKEFHFFIYGNLALKKFLTTGDIGFFENFQTESIYNLPEFLDFISPYFTQQYDKTFLDNYKQANHDTLIKLLANKPIVNALHYENCYKSTYSYIKEIDNEIKNIISEISSGKSSFINIKFVGLDKLIVEKINIDLLNLLPSYFQSLRNQLAMSIRNLARDINNKPFEYFEPAFRIIEVAYNISIDALTKQTISKGYFVIKKNYEEEVSKLEAIKREDENSRIITKWTEVESQIELIKNDVFDGNSRFISVNFLSFDIFILQIINIKELNNLTPNFQGIRTRIAEIVRILAKTINNEPYHNYKVAFDIINIAKDINTTGNTLDNIQNTFQTIKSNFDKELKQLQQSSTISFKNEYGYQQFDMFPKATWIEKANSIESIKNEIINGNSKFINSNFSTLYTAILQIVDVSSLNSLSEIHQKLRNQIAESIHILAKIIFDKPYQNFNVAYDLICLAESIKADGEIEISILQTHKNIKSKIIEKQASSKPRYESYSDKKYSKPKNVIKGIIIFVVVVLVFNFIQLIFKTETTRNTAQTNKTTEQNEKTIKSSNYSNTSTDNSSNTTITAGTPALDTLKLLVNAHNIYNRLLEINSNQPEKNQLALGSEQEFKNDIRSNTYDIIVKRWGDIGCSKKEFYNAFNSCIDVTHENNVSLPVFSYPKMTNGDIKGSSKVHPKYDMENNYKIIIECGNNADVAVKLVDCLTNKNIRYVYVEKNTTYSIDNIPEGKYKLKIAYGENWGIRDGEKLGQGRFTYHSACKKSKKILNFYQYSSFTVGLNVTYNKNDNMNKFDTNNISDKEFYNE